MNYADYFYNSMFGYPKPRPEPMRLMNLGDDRTLTMDKLLLTQAKFEIGGMKIIQSPFVEPEPVIRLRLDCDPLGLWCTPEFRATTDAWLRERFGVRDVAYISGRNVFVNPRAAAKIIGETRS